MPTRSVWPLCSNGHCIDDTVSSNKRTHADRPVTFFVRDSGLDHARFLKWLTRPPEAFVILSPFVLLAGLYVVLSFAWNFLHNWWRNH